MSATHYQVLGVNEQAGGAVLKRQYYVLSKKYHPDRGGDARKMAAINEAYRILNNPLLRSAYDRRLREVRRDAEADATAQYRKAPSEPIPQPTPPPRANAHTYTYEQLAKPKKHSVFGWFMTLGMATAALIIVGSYLLPVKETAASPNPAPVTPTQTPVAADQPAATPPAADTTPVGQPQQTTSGTPSTNQQTPSNNSTSSSSTTTTTPQQTLLPKHHRLWPPVVYNSTND